MHLKLFAGTIAAALVAPASALAQGAESVPPAGGASIGQIVIATVGAGVLSTLVVVLALGHRSGRLTVLTRIGEWSERFSGLPPWAAVPSGLAAGALIVALFGMLWDISLHIDNGRDEGPLANPAHYFILLGLFGVFAAGFLAIALPTERPGPTAVRIVGDWYAPMGGILITACGAFALIGFPLDDVWHRIFGQDVTLWGPTHLMLIGGAAMTLLGIAVLQVEAVRSNAAGGRPPPHDWTRFIERSALAGAFILGMSVFQAEFDFGVPQFREIFHPILIMIAAGAALVTARVYLGPGAAIAAVVFFLVMRGVIALIVGPILGQSTPYFPLYLVEAAVVELVALRVATTRPLAFGAWCGIGIGTFGLASEWGWSHAVMPIPWADSMVLEGVILGFAAAIAASIVGAWVGARLRSDEIPRRPSLRQAAVGAAAVLIAIVGYGLLKPPDTGVRADVTLKNATGGDERTVVATVRMTPRDAAEDAVVFNTTAWQGGGLVVEPLEQVGPGKYRTPEPIPVYGSWKTLIRLQVGNSLTAMPVYLPRDPAIPAPAVRAKSQFKRDFVNEHTILQREQKSAAGALVAIAYGVVIAITLGLLLLLAWGLHRLAVTAPSGSPDATPSPVGPVSRPSRPAASAT